MDTSSPAAPAAHAARFSLSKKLVLGFAGFVIVAGLGLQLMKMRDLKEGDRSSGVQGRSLASRLPASIPGWVAKDEPLGPNEFLQSAVERTLNYDDYVYRVYTRGGREFSVYVAYWSAGRMPVNKVASHTPDRCWTENGWKCVDMRFAEKLSSGNTELPPGQWRLFNPPQGTPQYVMYWHLVGDQLYDYGERFNEAPHPLKWWRDSLSYALKGSQAQYFIRITSQEPIESFVTDPGFGEIVHKLAELGLTPDVAPGLAI